jgi:hypothetical protein
MEWETVRLEEELVRMEEEGVDDSDGDLGRMEEECVDDSDDYGSSEDCS